jgi:hypothetical protein
MGQDNEQTGSTVEDYAGGGLGRVKIYFTLEITHQDGTVTKQHCVGMVTESVDG